MSAETPRNSNERFANNGNAHQSAHEHCSRLLGGRWEHIGVDDFQLIQISLAIHHFAYSFALPFTSVPTTAVSLGEAFRESRV